jgi:hypothetical protein
MTGDRNDLDAYLQSVNEEIQTTKISSELWFRSPSPHDIRENDRFVRSLIREGLGRVTPVNRARHQSAKYDAALIQSAYWEEAKQARDIAVHFGAAGYRTLEEYFMVDPGRSSGATLARARHVVAAFSPAGYLLQSIDLLSTADAAAPAESCRKAMAILARDWPDLVHVNLEQSGPVVSAADLLREFCNSVEARIARPRGPEQTSPDSSVDSPPVLLTAAEAREFATTYMLGRYCFTAEEYLMAKRLVAMPRLQSALLAVQLQLIAESREPLDRLLARFGTPEVLLPFTEVFVNRHGYNSSRLGLSPNPKLITVLCNNVVPAIAGELLRRGSRVDDLDADAIHAGIVAARRRHVFEIMIALFDRADGSLPDTVSLSGFSMRVCPALAPFSTFLEDWLPHYFECFS